MDRRPVRPARPLPSLACALALVVPALAHASPLQFVSPRDPLAAELRVLELYDLPADSGRFRLPHFNSWPLARFEVMGRGAPVGGDPVRRRVADRIERELQRDATRAFADTRALRSTPRAWSREWADDERAEISLGLEGATEHDEAWGEDSPRWRDGTGIHVRAGVQVDGWLLYTHLTAGQLRDASLYTDVLLQGSDLALQTEESYAAYHGGDGRWSVALGRQRFAWGPGEEGSLLLSRTAAPLTALHAHWRLPALHADLISINATTHPGREEQLAAHRLEWQPARGVRLGLSEAARYRSGGWQGVYLASVIPYSLAQRLLSQDGDTIGVNRNNVLMSFDASWRVADGTRVYGELLLDDVHAKSAAFPNKYGWQIGLDGAWTRGFTRLTWNAEYTWLSRYVYTSYYDRDFAAQGAPLGFPTGPDSRRLRTRLSWDPSTDWQVVAIAGRTWQGENDLDEPFVPGGPVPPVGTLEGVPEVSDDLTATVRWWPASGVDLSLSLGVRRTEDAGHVVGATRRDGFGSLAFRLTR